MPKIAFNNAGCLGRGRDISSIVANFSTSTNNTLIIGLLERGIDEIYQFNSSSLRLDESGIPITDAIKLKLELYKGNRNCKSRLLAYGHIVCSYIQKERTRLDDFDVILIRGDDIDRDPAIVNLFRKARKSLYLNSPEGTLATKDKFEIKPRARKAGIRIPQTFNVTDFQELLYALPKIKTKYKVIKARYGFGGQQVWRVSSKTTEKKLWTIFKQCDGEAVVQEYRKIIRWGDLRLNVFDGKVLGNSAILRQAQNEEWKTNIDLGGSQKPYKIDEKMKSIAKKVSEAYPKVRLQGVDLLLDGTFLETNAYPTTVGYTRKHFGIKARDVILDKIDKIPNENEKPVRVHL